ncbi:hypothetical protein ACFFP0_05275 [Rhizobium puerariae]|uniref:Uncharacterized protein n=1 Tax=Rhizobium puerariae TaxID=1585791 RepID=A0ABV6AFX2_9HYPH
MLTPVCKADPVHGANPSHLQSLLWTLFLTVVGFTGDIVFGPVVALMRVSLSLWLRMPAICWIGLFQGTPLLGFDLPAWGVAVAVVLTAHTSALFGEIRRSAIQAIPRGQSEAAQVLGLHAGG